MIQFYHLENGLYQGPYLWERDCMTYLTWLEGSSLLSPIKTVLSNN